MNSVREFHEAFGLPAPDTPQFPDEHLLRLRLRLLREEFKEVEADMSNLLRARSFEMKHKALLGLLKELCDLRYVTEGALVAFGFDPDETYAEVHRSNMSKLGADGKPIYDEGGKVLKGPAYEPADMSKFMTIYEQEEPNA